MRKIILSGEVWKEGNMYTSCCPELDVASCGKTIEQAWKNLNEALQIFIEETTRKGTLEMLLKEAGFSYEKEEIKREEHLLGRVELPILPLINKQ